MRMARTGLALLLAAALLAACSKVPTREVGSGATNLPATAPATVSTIRVMVSGGSDLDALISAYYDKYPNDRVEKVNPFTGAGSISLTDVTKEKIERGEIDVITYISPDLIAENKVVPLDPFIQKSNFDLAPFGSALDSLRHEGKLYELPYRIYPSLLLYNKEMFQQAGITPPAEGWTWDDLRVAAQKLTRGEGDQKVWGFSPEFADSVLSIYLSQSGQDYRQAYQDEQFIKDAFQLFGTMVQVDQSMPKAQRRSEDGGPIYSRDDFVQGKAAMTVANVSNLSFMFGGQQKIQYDAAPVPVRPGGKMSSQAYPQSFGIAANSPNQEAAWRFISFVTGPEGAAILAKAGVVPVHNSPAVKSAWFERDPAPPPGTETLFDTTWELGVRSSTDSTPMSGVELERFQQLTRTVRDSLNAVMAGEKSWEDGFAEYQRALKEFQSASTGS